MSAETGGAGDAGIVAGRAAPGSTVAPAGGAGGGEGDAYRALVPLVYDQLRRRARRYLAGRSGHTLEPTALVHEAFLKLAGGESGPRWSTDRHFYQAASEAMRQVLMDHAKSRGRAKRGGALRRVDLDRLDLAAPDAAGDSFDWPGLDEALRALEAEDERAYRVVMLRFFGGRSEAEVAALLGMSGRSVQREWKAAKLFLLAHLDGRLRPGQRGEGTGARS